jgi:hypothetical protein
LFLQKAFKKQGFWYFDYDIGFGVRYLEGKYTATDQNDSLKQAKFALASIVGKPYIQFGVTPQSLPDVLISIGPAAQVAVGNMTVNNASKSVVFGTSSYSGPMNLMHGFVELEIVLKRFGDGAFSVFSSSDLTGKGEGTKVFEGEVDGMSDFKGVFSHQVGGAAFGFGLKLVTTFP